MPRDVQDVLKVHHVAQNPDGTQRVVKTSPYVIVGGFDTGKLFLKNGQVMDENGVLVEEMPAWLIGELQKMSPNALQEIGFADRVPSRDASKKK